MSQNLIVVGFHGKHRASEVLGQLEQLTADWALDLKDAVAAYRTDDGRLRIDQSLNPTTKEGAGYGAFLGGMIGALLAAPFTGGMSTAAAATALGVSGASMGMVGGAFGADDAATFKQEYGISDEFVKEIGGMIAPGDSAVFAVIRGGNPEQVAERFRGYGGTILRTNLSPRVAERVQETLGAQ
jgi:uncharacterized membrane protein